MSNTIYNEDNVYTIAYKVHLYFTFQWLEFPLVGYLLNTY